MKKQILSFLFVLSAVLLISTSAYAQPLRANATLSSVSATTGSTITYSIAYDAANKYYWSFTTLTGSAPSVAPTVPAPGATGVGANQFSVAWDAGTANGTYEVVVYIVDGNGCYSEMLVRTITVSGTLAFKDATANTITCSDLAGTIVPATEKDGSQTAHSSSSFDIEYNGPENLTSVLLDIKDPAGASINLDGTSAAGAVTVTNGASDKDITINITDVWQNTTLSNQTFTINIVSGVIAGGGVVTFDPAKKLRTITIRPKSVITFN